MNKIALTALLFILTISNFLFAVDKKYLPINSDSVISVNLDTLAKKAGTDLQKTLNELFMQKYADRYLKYRDDEFVADAMISRLQDYIDFSKTSRIVFLNNYQEISILFDVKNLIELDKLMIKMASQENKLVSIDDNTAYRHLELDEYNLISWNKDVIAISLKLKDSHWYNEEINSHLTNSANLIFLDNTGINNEKFVSLDNETNDIFIWADISLLADQSIDFTKFLFGRSYNESLKDTYKDGILTAKINFNNGSADVVLDSYTPNSNYDITSLKKELSENIYSFVSGEESYGFLSLAFNSKVLSEHLRTFFKDSDISFPLIDEFAELEGLEEYGIDIYKLVELLGGDVFVSVWDDPDSQNDVNILASVSITDTDTVKVILEALAEDYVDDVYTVMGVFCYIKDSILYVSNGVSLIDSIVNNELPATKIDENKLSLAKNNTIALYLEMDPDLDLYGIDEYTEYFESLYLTSNVLENNHIQIKIKVNTRDKEKNSLSVIKSIFDY